MTDSTGADAPASHPCDAILARLLTLHPKVIDLSLERVHRLLERLGHPERALPPVVHVAGTNGKGSVIAVLRAVLEAAGYRVHVHISPHLVHFNERIRLAGKLIPDTDLQALLEECEDANGGEPITFFEITTAAALLAFAREPADVLILETGLGGRLDATNVIDRPLVTAISPISLDHQQFLGDTLEEIAAEKAGILKPGAPCVIGPQLPPVRAVLEDKAAAVGAPVLAFGREWGVEPAADGTSFRLTVGGETTSHPAPSLAGRHQLFNAAQALVCLKVMDGFRASADQVARGLASAQWPARLQRLTRGPLVRDLPPGGSLWLDGGHNAAAGATIAAHAREAWGEKPLHLICGMINSKDPRSFLAPLSAVAASLTGVAIPGEANTLSADDIAAAGRAAGLADVRTASSVQAALRGLTERAQGPRRVLICGSLYLAGSVLRDNA
ncbi:MAG: bifunctional folylpolyglutamate synthase/dihydrofolate synthase [Rhodospirillales bacterium CG15_BIG_FIL_POST_REV_8_21_14_020_66_15]|nr:MAG: bifunctional folylpolyglutamate synthase/dihydrofolate synthase [Rhodospirillales bacterium CG15_BIG_FIL_POST_REV_8_21_14_020_66_15]